MNGAPPRSRLGPILAAGFGASVAVWVAWFITHLPWLGMPERISVPILLGVWLVMSALAYRIAGVDPAKGSRLLGPLSGAVAAVLGLLVLGSKLGEAAPGLASLRPDKGLIVLGFIGLGTVIGAVGGLLARVLPRPLAAPRTDADGADWLPRLAIIAVVAVAPLLFVGGLVTSTNSGMAVPDWPNTFGSNMFLYPLGPRAAPGVYLEHSHRLFGSLIGLAVLAVMIGVLRSDDRRWVRRWAVAAFVLVCVQGALGGIRVVLGSEVAAEDNRFYSMAHGVLAQIVFAMLVALAVFLAPTYRALARMLGSPESGPELPPAAVPIELSDETKPVLRRLRFLATGAAHATLMQLFLGAAYRHFRSDHAMWTHAAFSVVVLVLVLGAAFIAQSLPAATGRIGAILRGAGRAMLIVVGIQFTLGWVTFAVGGREHEAAGVAQALVRTAHQANGALLLALATMVYIWARPLAPRALVATSAAAPADEVPAQA